MAEMRVSIDGTVPMTLTGSSLSTPLDMNLAASSITLATNANVTNSSLSTYQIGNPSITGGYVFCQEDVPGVAAANNYASVFNPIGSGKNLLFFIASVSATTAGGSAVTAPMRGYRVTAASGGTLQAASTVAKFQSVQANPVAEVRLGNPTVTLGAPIFNAPPAISATVSTTSSHTTSLIPPLGAFICVPGEGVVLRTTTSDVDLRWNFAIVWGEA